MNKYIRRFFSHKLAEFFCRHDIRLYFIFGMGFSPGISRPYSPVKTDGFEVHAACAKCRKKFTAVYVAGSGEITKIKKVEN